MSDLSPLIHEKVQIIMTIENGQVTGVCKVRDGELIASMDTFIRLAERAGYQITALLSGSTGRHCRSCCCTDADGYFRIGYSAPDISV